MVDINVCVCVRAWHEYVCMCARVRCMYVYVNDKYLDYTVECHCFLFSVIAHLMEYGRAGRLPEILWWSCFPFGNNVFFHIHSNRCWMLDTTKSMNESMRVYKLYYIHWKSNERKILQRSSAQRDDVESILRTSCSYVSFFPVLSLLSLSIRYIVCSQPFKRFCREFLYTYMHTLCVSVCVCVLSVAYGVLLCV